jgi:diaminohydroxyphosphoribosylaminopyrimidine deaminase/5-amino-6-(5-phosphoribosylamino)uracil reductase
VSLERALELAERGRGQVEHTHPLVGAVLVHGPAVVGEGWYAGRGSPHAEVMALQEAGERARGATLYVTLEPCAHHGRTPPCVDAILAAGIAGVVVGAPDPNPKTGGRGFAHLREGGVEVQLLDGEQAARARRQNEAWRTWISARRPFVTYKAAVTLDGRVVVPESRWVTGEKSRRRVHELRAASDAVAVGMGTVRADSPRLDARDVGAERQPRRLAFGHGSLPEGSELELVSGPLDGELERLAGEGVQSLLLEGGPTLATAFLREGLVDKLLLFVAPTLAGSGPRWVDELEAALSLSGLEAERVGEDILLTGYIHEP